MRVAKTKALISFAVTAKLICVFVFAYAKTRFSHDEAQISSNTHLVCSSDSIVNLPYTLTSFRTNHLCHGAQMLTSVVT